MGIATRLGSFAFFVALRVPRHFSAWPGSERSTGIGTSG
jgi:hypothetical protein